MTDHRSPKIHRDPGLCETCRHRWHQDGLCDECANIGGSPFCRRGLEVPDPDPLTVEAEPLVEHVPYHGWESARERWARAGDRPAHLGCVHFGLGVCIGILIAALVLVGSSIDAPAPRSAPDPTTTSPVVDVRPGPASPSALVTGTSGLELSPASEPTGDVSAGPRYSASATWCAPTPTQCHGWGGDARLGAVFGFRWGDTPWWARVWRGERFADVLIVSHCACGGTDAAIDLSPAAFALLAPLSRGRIAVAVEVLDWPGDSDDPPPHPDDERMRAEDR